MSKNSENLSIKLDELNSDIDSNLGELIPVFDAVIKDDIVIDLLFRGHSHFFYCRDVDLFKDYPQFLNSFCDE